MRNRANYYFIGITLGFALLGGCQSESATDLSSLEQCQLAHERVIDLRMELAHGKTASAADRREMEKHREVLRSGLRDRFMAECQSRSSAEVRCLLDATDLDGVRGCGERSRNPGL